MKYHIWIIFCCVLISCKDRVIYQNASNTIWKKDFFSKGSTLDSHYYSILKQKKWRLKFYAIKKNKEIYNTDSIDFSFKFIKDTLIIVNLEDTAIQLPIKSFHDYYNRLYEDMDSLEKEEFLFKFFEHQNLIVELSNNNLEIFLITVLNNRLVCDVRKYGSQVKDHRWYRLYFEPE